MPDIVCLGEALIDFVAQEPCEDVGAAGGFVRAAGGAPANVAVGAARLGCSSAFLGKVGDDPFGRYLERTFAASGVETSGMVFDPKNRTGLAFVSLAENGERDFCFFRNPSADMTYTGTELDLDAISSCRFFHFGSITLIEKAPRAATLAAAAHAKSRSIAVSFDPNYRPPLWPSEGMAVQYMRKGVRAADIVKVSVEELCLISKGFLPSKQPLQEDINDLSAYFMRRFGNVMLLAVTNGERGCTWRAGSSVKGRHKGFKVNAVDTTGAGDGFVAGMLTGLLQMNVMSGISLDLDRDKLDRLFERACAVGALTTTKKGAIPALPTTVELDQFLAARSNLA